VYGACGATPEFVKLAYRVADEVLREYGIREQVTLLYNDYNTFDGSMPDRMISLVEFINSDGVICDGVGMQAHMDVSFPRDRSVFAEAVRKFLNAGLAVHITELDITINNPTATSEKSQQDFYVRVFLDLLEIRENGGDISSITLWGMADNVSWRGQHSPLLFEKRSTPKKAYYEVLRAFGEGE
jgi:GH35 family endo-1,4-beta-xylanase